MDTIASMRAFVAVAKAGSFSAAAQKLDLVPSVITKRVTQLERIVGKTLLHRSTRKVGLSADGEHHLERIIAAIAAHDQALTELRKGVRRLTGPIRIKELYVLHCSRFGIADPRGAHARARCSRRNLVFGWVPCGTRTMKQLFASAVRLRGGGPLLDTASSHGCVRCPPTSYHDQRPSPWLT